MRPHVYEHRSEPLISMPAFIRRLAGHIVAGVVVLGGSVTAGMLGYMGLAGLSPVDAFLNASMILAGMGPVDPLPTDAAKVFAGTYALYSGIVFLIVVGIVAAPVVHRILHRLHLEADAPSEAPE